MVEQLSNLARGRTTDFVWELVGAELTRLGLPAGFRALARRRIAQFYSTVTSELMGASLDKVEHGVGRGRSAVDTALFLECLRILEVDSLVANMTPPQLAALKIAPSFILFREFYFKLLLAVGFRSAELTRWLPIYRESEQRYRTAGINRTDFLNAFRDLAKSLGRPPGRYTKPLAMLVAACDMFQRATIQEFVALLGHTVETRAQERAPAQHDVFTPAAPVTSGAVMAKKKHVFLSYVREDFREVEELRRDLTARGEVVWWDQDILPGQDWELTIQQAIKESYAFIMCLSAQTDARGNSGVFPELLDAIGVLRRYRPGSIFLIPACLAPCTVPDFPIDSTRSIARIQRVDLYPSTRRQAGVDQLVAALQRAPDHP